MILTITHNRRVHTQCVIRKDQTYSNYIAFTLVTTTVMITFLKKVRYIAILFSVIT